ncbi:Hypothetical predicted protein [Olea europaea subsp. europaea]|uniref:Uncharacterized protein n=1 Tax=Olea europaea subsp. europaea TaxID=158383 RepID=A0A8S0SVU1_OLEEU|nr:Hypothetical predicted protein [Olea europaea subsp. europaea]
MDGNKDEALRCTNIAKEAIASGNKKRALKFVGLVRRLNQNLPVDDLLALCENLDLSSSPGLSDDVKNVNKMKDDVDSVSGDGIPNGMRNYLEEHVQLIREIIKEAFEKVSKAFKCLIDDDLRGQYDQTGLVEDFEYNQQYNVRQRRRRTGNDFFADDFDPNDVFRAFFGQNDVFRNAHVYKTNTNGPGH